MARGRMISTDSALDPELMSLTLPAIALYLLSIPHLDRDGLIDGHPLSLTARVAPLRADLRDQAEQSIQEWIDASLVVRYATGRNKLACFFHGFRKHQQGMRYDREPASRWPPPPGWTRTPEGLVPDDPDLARYVAGGIDERTPYYARLMSCGTSPDDFRKSSGDSPVEENTNHGGGGDHHTTFVRENGGGAGGGTGVASALADFSREQLVHLADAMASEFGLQSDWNGWVAYLARLDTEKLYQLIGWLQHYRRNSEQLEAVRNLPGLIRRKLTDGEQPPWLRPTDIEALANDAYALIAP